jgi:glycerol-3-phosphate acyltransferase PlsX
VIHIALDAMGGDHAPQAEIQGVAQALAELPPSFVIQLVGRTAAIEAALAQHPTLDRSRVQIVEAPVMAASTLILRLHRGVQRAAIGALLPTAKDPVLLLDAGANVDCDARELVGFAHLGAVYARDVLGRVEPAVGLLNIGEEDEKGNAVVKEAHQLLQHQTGFTYLGNVEGRDVPEAAARGRRLDVVVCDGFVGNVVLKFYESAGRVFVAFIKRDAPDILKRPDMGNVLKILDWATYGGAPLLGVQGVSIICHGSSPARAFANAIRVALQAVESHLSRDIEAEFARGEDGA